MNNFEFTVTRQSRWPDGEQIVEITQGNLDYANPDMLVCKYAGEGKTYTGFRPAVDAAISIAQQWQKDKPHLKISIASGFTHGMTAILDEMPLCEESFETLRKGADEFDQKLPRCAECGNMLGEERYSLHDIGEYDCCSEHCAEKHYQPVPDDDE